MAQLDRDHRPPRCRGGGRKHKHTCDDHGHSRGRGCGCGNEPRSKNDEYGALLASVATLSNSINVMVTRMGPGASGIEDDDAKPAADDKMKSNAHNSALTKNLKKEKE